MRTSLLLVVALGCAFPLAVACSGRAVDLEEASAGAAGSGVAGSETTAGTSPGGASGSGGALPLAGAGGSKTLREPELHRPTVVACDETRPSNDPGVPAGAASGWVQCRAHADCTEGKNGRCGGNGHDGYYCTYDLCFTDADCPTAATGEAQLCGCEQGFRSDNNLCLPGNCRVDADCGGGGFCSPSLGGCGNFNKFVGYYCHTPEDECSDDSDCKAAAQSSPGYCAFMPEIGHWKCSTAQCVG